MAHPIRARQDIQPTGSTPQVASHEAHLCSHPHLRGTHTESRTWSSGHAGAWPAPCVSLCGSPHASLTCTQGSEGSRKMHYCHAACLPQTGTPRGTPQLPCASSAHPPPPGSCTSMQMQSMAPLLPSALPAPCPPHTKPPWAELHPVNAQPRSSKQCQWLPRAPLAQLWEMWMLEAPISAQPGDQLTLGC